MSDENSKSGATASSSSVAQELLSGFTNSMITAIERISKVAEKGPVTLLTTIGTVLLMLAVVMKFEFNGHKISNLTTGEFVTMVISASLLLIFGSFLRLWQYKSGLQTLKEQQKVGANLLAKTSQTGADLAKSDTSSLPNL
jgi:hypothetical protein